MIESLSNCKRVESSTLRVMPTGTRLQFVGGEDVEMRIPLLERLRNCGFGVGAIGSRSPEPFEKPGIDFFRYRLERGIHPLADRQSRRELRQIFKVQQPHVVHAFDTKPTILAMLAAASANVPCRVRTITGMGFIFSSNSPLAHCLRPVYRRLQRKAARVTTHTIFQNSDDQAYFLKHHMVLSEQHSVVLGSGIDVGQLLEHRPQDADIARLRAELGIGSRFVVTMVARMVKHKGVAEFLFAAREVKQRLGDAVHFLLVGPLSSEGRQAVDARLIEEHRAVVQYLGPRTDVATLLAASNLFVLPSYYREGVPRVLLEAGAMQLPLITTNMPGCREVVRDGINGRIVEPRNAPQLAAAIAELVYSPQQCRTMGQASLAWVRERFDLSLVANQYANVYRTCLERRRDA